MIVLLLNLILRLGWVPWFHKQQILSSAPYLSHNAWVIPAFASQMMDEIIYPLS